MDFFIVAMRYDDYMLLGWFSEKSEEGKLMEWMKSSVPVKFALYNISRDPSQQNNLAQSEPEMVERLKPILIKKWIDIRDEGPNWQTN